MAKNALLTTKEVAKLLRCSERHVRRMCELKQIKAKRLDPFSKKSSCRVDMLALKKQYQLT